MNAVKRILIIVAVILCLSACKKEENMQDKRPRVVTTTNLIADIVRNVGGNFVVVSSLMSPGVDPHLYRASEGDVIKLAGADIIFYNGLHLEGKLSEVLLKAGNAIPSYAVAQNIPEDALIYEGASVDPHVWFDPLLWIYAVNVVADGLVEIDPDNELYYRKNEEAYVLSLIELNDEASKRLGEVPESKRILLTSHDAFAYFGRAFGWRVVGIQGINTASETSVYTIQALAKTVVSDDISCIFTESSVPSRSIDALAASVRAQGKNLKIGMPLYSDSLGERGTEAEGYIGMFMYNVNSIVTGITDD